MNSELIDDLKQFIEAAFVQHLSASNERFDTVERRLDNVELRLDTIADSFGTMLVDHDLRMSQLEGSKA